MKGLKTKIASKSEEQSNACTSIERSSAALPQIPKKSSSQQQKPVGDREAEIVHFAELGKLGFLGKFESLSDRMKKAFPQWYKTVPNKEQKHEN